MERLAKIFRKRHLSRTALVLYLLISLPIVLIFAKSEHVRFVATQLVTNWRGALFGIKDVYVGDSITAGGRNWGSIFNAINLAANNYTVSQVEHQIVTAAKFSPERIFILAGTNDILGKHPFDPPSFEKDYASLLSRAAATKAKIFVTLIPYTAHARDTPLITIANRIILTLASQQGIPTLDLNPHIAPDGILRPQYTVDGVHLNRSAYTIWRSLINQAIIDTRQTTMDGLIVR